MPRKLSYSLRFPGKLQFCFKNDTCLWETNHKFETDMFEERPGERDSIDSIKNLPLSYFYQPSYLVEGFLTIQNAIFNAYMKNHVNKSIPEIQVQPFPYRPYVESEINGVGFIVIASIFLLSFNYAFVNSVQYIADEKERQLKESMKIMGLARWQHYSCWFIRTMIMLLIPTVIIAILLTVISFGYFLLTIDFQFRFFLKFRIYISASSFRTTASHLSKDKYNMSTTPSHWPLYEFNNSGFLDQFSVNENKSSNNYCVLSLVSHMGAILGNEHQIRSITRCTEGFSLLFPKYRDFVWLQNYFALGATEFGIDMVDRLSN